MEEKLPIIFLRLPGLVYHSGSYVMALTVNSHRIKAWLIHNSCRCSNVNKSDVVISIYSFTLFSRAITRYHYKSNALLEDFYTM